MLRPCFEPVSCAIALSALEHVLRAPRRACPRARLWLRRAPSDLLLDAALGEASDPLFDTLNLIDAHSFPGTGLLLLGLLVAATGMLAARAPAGEAGDVALGVIIER
jgi:hypothetical protein